MGVLHVTNQFVECKFADTPFPGVARARPKLHGKFAPFKGAMKMKTRCTKIAAMVIVLMLTAIGCSPSATSSPPPTPGTTTPSFPVGIFTSVGWTWEFKVDGSFVAEGPGEGEKGTYTVTGNQIVFKGDYCGDVTGTYTWTFDGKALSFKALDDQCNSRRDVVVRDDWSRK